MVELTCKLVFSYHFYIWIKSEAISLNEEAIHTLNVLAIDAKSLVNICSNMKRL